MKINHLGRKPHTNTYEAESTVAKKQRQKRQGGKTKKGVPWSGGGIKLQDLQRVPARVNKSLSSVVVELDVRPPWLRADAVNAGKCMLPCVLQQPSTFQWTMELPKVLPRVLHCRHGAQNSKGERTGQGGGQVAGARVLSQHRRNTQPPAAASPPGALPHSARCEPTKTSSRAGWRGSPEATPVRTWPARTSRAPPEGWRSWPAQTAGAPPAGRCGGSRCHVRGGQRQRREQQESRAALTDPSCLRPWPHLCTVVQVARQVA